MVNLTEADYKVAQAGDAKARQEFLDALDLEDAREYVKDVFYQSSSFSSNKNGSFTAMTCDSPIFTFFKISLSLGRSDLVVYPESFTLSYPQFISSLVNHEGLHARQSAYHPYFYTKIYFLKKEAKEAGEGLFYKYLDALIEVPALANELMGSDKVGLTYNEKYTIATRTSIGLANLHSYSERDLMKDFRKIMCNTHGDYFAEKLIFEKDPSIFLL